MQQTWPHEDKVQFCRWFLGLDDTADLMAELGEEPEEDRAQGILFCDGNHAETTPCGDPHCWHKGEDDEIEAESNTSRTQAKGTIQ